MVENFYTAETESDRIKLFNELFAEYIGFMENESYTLPDKQPSLCYEKNDTDNCLLQGVQHVSKN